MQKDGKKDKKFTWSRDEEKCCRKEKSSDHYQVPYLSVKKVKEEECDK